MDSDEMFELKRRKLSRRCKLQSVFFNNLVTLSAQTGRRPSSNHPAAAPNLADATKWSKACLTE